MIPIALKLLCADHPCCSLYHSEVLIGSIHQSKKTRPQREGPDASDDTCRLVLSMDLLLIYIRDAIRAGVGLGLGPRLGYTMLAV